MLHDDMTDQGDVDHHAQVRARIVRMANQIATFFASKPGEAAAKGVASHINDFWEPRMRVHLFDLLEQNGSGLSDLVRQAAPMIRKPQRQAAGSER
jgi:formate dehydrogenase subunit delta